MEPHMFHYLLLQWPRVRAHDSELVILKVPVIKSEVGLEKSPTYSYPLATFPFAASMVLDSEFKILRNAVVGFNLPTDEEGLATFFESKAIDYNSEDFHEWRYALLQRSIISKVVEIHGSLANYHVNTRNDKSLAYTALLPFFVSSPVKNMNVQGTKTGRLSASQPNKANGPNSVNSECVDCND